MLIAESLSLCHSSTRRYSHLNTDFIGELGNAHFPFRQHDIDVNDDCHVCLDNQIVESLVKTDKKWDEGQVYIRQKWVLEIYLKKRGVHVPALEVGFPKQEGKNAYPGES